ncbi:MAG: hypothetical protein INR72_01185 [Williamsia herbipolensis]|nr:hypothetical protein [Williamsia herbipolensis]
MVDWSALGDRLAGEIVDAVAVARRGSPDRPVSYVQVVDVHTRDLLVLWPTITVYHEGSPSPVVVEGSRAGDLAAAEVTSLGGPGGTRWEVVFSRFHTVLAAGCTLAGRAVGVPVRVASDTDAGTDVSADIDEHVAVDGPLDYGPLTDALSRRPELDTLLAAGLSADRVRPVDADDVATAIAALDSPWDTIRRHASIVLLSVHL